jgi:drug/metabolite transporter (DMT)-like permease
MQSGHEGDVMREVAGAILVLAGSVLIAAGVVADALPRDHGGHGNTGYVLGAIVGLVGVALLVGGTLRRAWDAIPVDERRPKSGSPA